MTPAFAGPASAFLNDRFSLQVDWDEFVTYYNGLMDRLKRPGAFKVNVSAPVVKAPEPPAPSSVLPPAAAAVPPTKPKFSSVGSVGKQLAQQLGSAPSPELLAALHMQVGVYRGCGLSRAAPL